MRNQEWHRAQQHGFRRVYKARMRKLTFTMISYDCGDFWMVEDCLKKLFYIILGR